MNVRGVGRSYSPAAAWCDCQSLAASCPPGTSGAVLHQPLATAFLAAPLGKANKQVFV